MRINVAPVDVFIKALGKKTSEQRVKCLLDKYSLSEDNTFEDTTYYENPSLGISLLCEDEIVDQVFLFSKGRDDFSQYGGGLPNGLTFESKKEDINFIFGEPTLSGKYQLSKMESECWDKYVFPNFSIHFTYNSSSQKIDLITLIYNENKRALD